MPYYWKEFTKKYPTLVGKKQIKEPFDARFDTKLGTLIKIFSFNLKGSTTAALKSIKVLSRIESPEELLEQQTPQAKFLYKRYEKLNKEYEFLRARAFKAHKKDDKFFIFKYAEDQTSFTKDLSDDMMYHHQDKIIVLARERSEHLVMSIRTSNKGPVIKPAFEKALLGIEGSGGGHDHACGAKIAKKDFKQFIKVLREELSL